MKLCDPMLGQYSPHHTLTNYFTTIYCDIILRALFPFFVESHEKNVGQNFAMQYQP